MGFENVSCRMLYWLKFFWCHLISNVSGCIVLKWFINSVYIHCDDSLWSSFLADARVLQMTSVLQILILLLKLYVFMSLTTSGFFFPLLISMQNFPTSYEGVSSIGYTIHLTHFKAFVRLSLAREFFFIKAIKEILLHQSNIGPACTKKLR